MKIGRFEDLLEICLSRLDQGESLSEILKTYPDHEQRLKPILLIAMLSRALPQPAPAHTSIRTGMNYLLTEMDTIQAAGGFRKAKPERTPDRIVKRWLENLPNPFSPERAAGLRPSYRLAIIILVLVMGGSFLTLSASASGLSGNLLSNLKRGLERVRSVLMYNQPAVENVFENDDFPKGNQGNLGESTSNNQETRIVIDNKSNSGTVNPDPDSDFVFDFSGYETIDELKEILLEEKLADKEADKLDKEAEKEADTLEKEADKEADKEEKEADKEEKEADKEDKKEDKEADKEEKEDDKEKKDK